MKILRSVFGRRAAARSTERLGDREWRRVQRARVRGPSRQRRRQRLLRRVTIGSALVTAAIIGTFQGKTGLAEVGPAPVAIPFAIDAEAYAMPELVYEAAVVRRISTLASRAVERTAPRLAGDTIRYRICKDLTVCFVDFAAPAPGIAAPLLPLQIGAPKLLPVESLAIAPAPPSRWLVLGVPLLGLASLLHRGGQELAQEPGIPHGTIPEPGSLILLSTGMLGVQAWRRRRRGGSGH